MAPWTRVTDIQMVPACVITMVRPDSRHKVVDVQVAVGASHCKRTTSQDHFSNEFGREAGAPAIANILHHRTIISMNLVGKLSVHSLCSHQQLDRQSQRLRGHNGVLLPCTVEYPSERMH